MSYVSLPSSTYSLPLAWPPCAIWLPQFSQVRLRCARFSVSNHPNLLHLSVLHPFPTDARPLFACLRTYTDRGVMGAAVSHPSLSASSTHHQQLWGKEGGTRRRGSGRAGKNRGSTAQGLKGVGTTSSPPVDILASPCEVEEGRGGGVKGGGEGRDKKAREGERVEGSRIGEAGAPGVRFVATEGLGDPQAEHEVFTPSYAAYTPSSRKTHGLR